MSRIGRAPIPLPDGVEFTYDNALVTVKGPKGELMQRVPRRDDRGARRTASSRSGGPPTAVRTARLHGLTRTLIANMVEGVTKGFEKRLEIVGVGYRASVKGDNLELLVGYSHPVRHRAARAASRSRRRSPQVVLVRGIDKQVVGEMAANDPRHSAARALQGQGHPLRGRVRAAQGRQARLAPA